jgi:hypothetical protein
MAGGGCLLALPLTAPGLPPGPTSEEEKGGEQEVARRRAGSEKMVTWSRGEVVWVVISRVTSSAVRKLLGFTRNIKGARKGIRVSGEDIR